MIHLLILQHNKTGLKYLCKRTGSWENYSGSGTLWKKHLKENGKDISRTLVGSFETVEEFKKVSVKMSKDLNIVFSNEWANQRVEEGDGGDTKSGLACYNNGSKNKFFVAGTQPSGWVKGRCDVWNFTYEKQAIKSNKSSKSSKKVEIDGVVFETGRKAALALGVSTEMVSRRCLSKTKWDNWRFV